MKKEELLKIIKKKKEEVIIDLQFYSHFKVVPNIQLGIYPVNKEDKIKELNLFLDELNSDIELIETKDERRFPYNFNVGDTIILDSDSFIIESEEELIELMMNERLENIHNMKKK